MSAASFLDANVLVYTDDHGAPKKQAIALRLVEAGHADGTAHVSTQVLEEYYVAATRKLRVGAAVARAKVELFARLHVVRIDVEDILAAIDLQRLYQLSFWDSLLIQCARRAGCATLITEDLQDGRRFDQLEIRNPFK
ncbi:MAG: PIN domain-containing protein [Cyanobacteria bacterium]|nr:PIN domain-containing protein [Cyanobacteriota bacterium]